MDCSQAFSVEKNQQRRSLTERLCWFFMKLVRPLSPFYSEKTNGTSHQAVCCWAYIKEAFSMLCFLIKVLLSTSPLISSRSKQQSPDNL